MSKVTLEVKDLTTKYITRYKEDVYAVGDAVEVVVRAQKFIIEPQENHTSVLFIHQLHFLFGKYA